MFVDSDHATYETTRWSRTGYFICVNSALVNWLSKKQATIEISVFGEEFVRGIHYKIRMIVVRISCLTYIYGDNMSVIHNTQRQYLTLRKKLNSICYHAVQ